MDTITFENLEEKLQKYREEDRNNSQILTTEDFSHYCNQRRVFYVQLGREIGVEREFLFHKILEPLEIKPIVKRDLKTIIGGLSFGIIGAPFSILGILGYYGYKSLPKVESKHGDQYTLFGLAIPLIVLGYAISEIRNPKPIAYKIKNKNNLESNNISKTKIGISLLNQIKEGLNPDYIGIGVDGAYPIKLHLSDDISFSLSSGFNNTEYKEDATFYFKADQLLIEKFEQFRKISKAYVENYNQLETLENITYPRLINNPNPNWVKATAL